MMISSLTTTIFGVQFSPHQELSTKKFDKNFADCVSFTCFIRLTRLCSYWQYKLAYQRARIRSVIVKWNIDQLGDLAYFTTNFAPTIGHLFFWYSSARICLIFKMDTRRDGSVLTVFAAYQTNLVTSKMMTSQVVQWFPTLTSGKYYSWRERLNKCPCKNQQKFLVQNDRSCAGSKILKDPWQDLIKLNEKHYCYAGSWIGSCVIL